MINVDAMRFVDRYFGLPLCCCLSLLRLLSRLIGRTKLPPPHKILVIKLSEMGSTVLAYPAIEALKRKVPGLELRFLTFGPNRTVLETMTPPENVLAIDVSSPLRMLLSCARLLWRLRREGIDTTIDMDFFSRFGAILAFLVCRGNRAGFHRFTSEGLGRGKLLTHPVAYSPHVHTAAAFMALVEALLAPDPASLNTRQAIHSRDLRIPFHQPTPSARAAVRRNLAQAGAGLASTETRMVLINPNSSDLFPLRRWPLPCFAELSGRLLQEYPNVSLVITGTAAEQADAKAILDRLQSPRAVSLAGRTTFLELLALYSEAHAMVTNDSGPAHFAALLRLPTVVLFGPETPALYSPMNPNARCLYGHFACSPCVSVYNAKKSPCARSLCLEAITVDEVLRNVREILAAPRPG
jgi:ADP-heptose:LPS heptosyltransferase